MAAEAFDPFANDDEDDFETHPSPPRRASSSVVASSPSSSGAPPRVSPPRISPPRASPRRRSSRDVGVPNNNDVSGDDIMKEFDTAFTSMTLGNDDDDAATDQFGFPSNCFPASFEHDIADHGTSYRQHDMAATSHINRPPPAAGVDLEGVKFSISETMSVIHKAESSQCSVKVRGNVSLEALPSHAQPGHQLSCDLSFYDPDEHLDATASKNHDFLHPTRDVTGFHLSMPELNGAMDNWAIGSPLLEYTCGEQVRPVPMLINTTVQELNNQCCQIMFQLRVNPRNINSLLNAVVLVCVPPEFDGENAQVSSVGRSIGKGKIDTNWSGITRILSWRLGELYSGAICELEALFLPRDNADESVQEMNDGSYMSETKFPILLRYDSEGSLLSGVDLEIGKEDSNNNAPTVKRKFRVYHREI